MAPPGSNMTFWHGATMAAFTSVFTVLGFWLQTRLLEKHGNFLEEQYQFKKSMRELRDQEVRNLNDGNLPENVPGRRPRVAPESSERGV